MRGHGHLQELRAHHRLLPALQGGGAAGELEAHEVPAAGGDGHVHLPVQGGAAPPVGAGPGPGPHTDGHSPLTRPLSHARSSARGRTGRPGRVQSGQSELRETTKSQSVPSECDAATTRLPGR